ncbi:unnamed protein product [Rotaria sordida]|uniref:IBR domain-containing protein n=2 Tax=Rotaria sordida TaxID=392033 RepID=A0A815HQ88_9BILA|nr:unnamed protein product [Rotaria sordida]CAF1604143.1 unnamed protein product [Rotaria sordida]
MFYNMNVERISSSMTNIKTKPMASQINQSNKVGIYFDIYYKNREEWINQWILKSQGFYLHRNPVYDTRSKNTSVTNTNTTQNEDEIYLDHDKTDDHSDDNEYHKYIRQIYQDKPCKNQQTNGTSLFHQLKKMESDRITKHAARLASESTSTSNEITTQILTRECDVCLLIKSEQDFSPAYSTRCRHKFRHVCNLCTYMSIKVILDDIISGQVLCPESKCLINFNSDEISQVLAINKDHVLLEKYHSYLDRQFLDNLDDFYWCAHGCDSGQIVERKSPQDLKITCITCAKDTCIFHRVKWHEDMTCDQYDQLHPSIDSMTNKWMKKNSKKCPEYLAYDVDLSTRIVPFIDIDARDRTNSAYYLNSYAVDFFNHDSETSLILENQINLDETNHLLLDFSLMFSSIKTSLEIIIRNENEQATINDKQCCQPLYEKMSNIKEIFAEKFYKAYPYTKLY